MYKKKYCREAIIVIFFLLTLTLNIFSFTFPQEQTNQKIDSQDSLKHSTQVVYYEDYGLYGETVRCEIIYENQVDIEDPYSIGYTFYVIDLGEDGGKPNENIVLKKVYLNLEWFEGNYQGNTYNTQVVPGPGSITGAISDLIWEESSVACGHDYGFSIVFEYTVKTYWAGDCGASHTLSGEISLNECDGGGEGEESITVTNPDRYSKWTAGTSENIEWTSTGNFEHVSIDLYKDDTYLFQITAKTENDGSFYYSIPLNLETSDYYQFRLWKVLTDIIEESYSSFSDYFTINGDGDDSSSGDDDGGTGDDGGDKSITINKPDSSTDWIAGDSEYIYWSSTGTIPSVHILLYKFGESYLAIATETENDGSYQWQIPTNCETNDYYKIKIVDSSDDSTYGVSDYFSINANDSGTGSSGDDSSGDDNSDNSGNKENSVPSFSNELIILNIAFSSVLGIIYITKKRIRIN